MFQLRWIWRYMDKSCHVRFVFGMILSGVTSGLLLVNPFLSSLLINTVIVGQNTAPLLPLLGLMMGVTVTRLGLRYTMILLLETASQNALFNLRCRLYRGMEYQEMRFFDRYRTGDLMTRLSADLDWCRHFLAYLSFNVVDTVVMFVSTLTFFLFIQWELALILTAITPILMLVTRRYASKVNPQFVDMRARFAKLNSAAQENIAGNRAVKAFAREPYENERFDEKNHAFLESNLRINRTWMTFFPFLESMAGLMTIITIFIGGLFIMLGRLDAGGLFIFTSLTWALATPMRNLGPLLNDLQRFFTSADKIIEVFYARPLIADRPDAAAPGAAGKANGNAADTDAEDKADASVIRGAVVFDHVSFSHGKTGILHDVSFTVPPGKTLAVMGPTGGGKTTLIQLLARFYDTEEGAVSLDGVNVRDWPLHALRHAVGCATQDVFLFSDTVEGNIAYGDLTMSEEDVHDFARRAAAAEFIEHMPQGYDTIVGERGVGLSGGQKQRLALARALAIRPTVLVLDDTTSALDMETEVEIQKQLHELPFVCTKIIIAGRVSSAKDADEILILDSGRITERGTHRELLAARGYYYETYLLQNASFIPPESSP
ncbi:MAG: ABC transporter ATP-binding protein/permease [Oscillospiraceae bacterium]|nr:ABC transporter ATP-binding protein/permease [Oscillospiraceae bacterium]